MVLHKQLRVFGRGTPCMIVDDNECIYNGTSDTILSRLTSSNAYRDSFVKRVDLIGKESDDLKDYNMNHPFLKIIVKKK